MYIILLNSRKYEMSKSWVVVNWLFTGVENIFIVEKNKINMLL